MENLSPLPPALADSGDLIRRMRTFPAIPQSVHGARRFACDVLAGLPAAFLESAELMVSELATNCIRHERMSFYVTVSRSPRGIRVEVTDSGSGMPALRAPGPSDPSGRGLQIVDMLSDEWGVEPEVPAGKTVWFLLAVDPQDEQRPDADERSVSR